MIDAFEVRGQLSELAIEVRQIEQERDDLKLVNAKLSQQIAQLQAALRREHPSTLQANAIELEQQLSHMHTRIRSLERELLDREDATAFANADAREANGALKAAVEAAKHREEALRARITFLESSLGESKSQLAVARQQRDTALQQLAETRDNLALAEHYVREQDDEQELVNDENQALVTSHLIAAAKKRKLDQFVGSLGRQHGVHEDDDDDNDNDDGTSAAVETRKAPTVTKNTEPGSVLAGIRSLLGGYVAAFTPVSDPFSLIDAEAAALAAAESNSL